jgi:hypothetical protein
LFSPGLFNDHPLYASADINTRGQVIANVYTPFIDCVLHPGPPIRQQQKWRDDAMFEEKNILTLFLGDLFAMLHKWMIKLINTINSKAFNFLAFLQFYGRVRVVGVQSRDDRQ